MDTRLATKADLQIMKQEIAIAVRTEIQALRSELRVGLSDLSAGQGPTYLHGDRDRLSQSLERLLRTVTIRFGVILTITLSLFYVAMKLT